MTRQLEPLPPRGHVVGTIHHQRKSWFNLLEIGEMLVYAAKVDKEKIQRLLADIWRRHLPEMKERLAVLQRACTNLKEGHIDASEREKAVFAAHKLAGALGTFGKAEGSELARVIEHRFEEGGPSPEALQEVESMLDRISLILKQP